MRRSPSDGRAAGPVFVGGTGRSGTSAVGALVGAHPAWAFLSYEMGLHTSKKGLAGMLDGHISQIAFQREMHTYWWHRRPQWDPSRERGLSGHVPRARFELATTAFALRTTARPPGPRRTAACRALMQALVHPATAAEGTRWFAETTPRNAAAAPALWRIFPEAKFIHVVRDGRDVACSFQRVPWIPTADPVEALTHWEGRLVKADAGIRRLPSDRTLVVRLEELVLTRRQETYKRLLDFLGVDDHPAMRAHFDTEITPENGHLGRWQGQLDEVAGERLRRAHEEAVERLNGILSFPLELDPLPEGFSVGVHGGSDVDQWSPSRAERR